MKMREIVLDTETTGLDPRFGHRVVEIGCVELLDYIPSGRVYHTYINPERSMPAAAFAVHGLSQKFLQKHRTFKDVAKDFLNFVQDSPLVIHNAAFDMKFLQAELEKHTYPLLENSIVDTLSLAREKFPGSPASLDALCKRFNVDATSRTQHGALLDARLLAHVYLELRGGTQRCLNLQGDTQEKSLKKQVQKQSNIQPPRVFTYTQREEQEHCCVVEKLPQARWKTV